MRLMTILTLALPVLTASSLSAAPISVGFAEVDVSPEIGKKPVLMAGFGMNRVATKIHDPIMARAIVLSDGKVKLAMVCVDVVGLFNPSVQRVRDQLKGFDHILVSSTHNHEAPDTLGLWGKSPFQSGVDADYLKKIEDGAAKAVQLAETARRPADAKLGTAKGPELLHDARLPEVKHDELVAILFESATPEKPAGILVQWNCHPETLDSKNTEVSADYVASTVRYLKETYKCPVVYFTGTVGGLMTSLHVDVKNDAGVSLKDGTFEKTEKYGLLVGKLAEKALANAKPVDLAPFEIRSQEFLVPVDNGLYRLAYQAGVLQRTMYLWEGTATPKKFIPEKDITKPIAVKSEIAYLKLGELDIASIPGEIYPELVLSKVQTPVDPAADFPDAAVEPGIYAQMTAKHHMLIGLANDELGYFLPKRQWDEKPPYCYGLKKQQYGEVNSVGPEAGPIICGVFKALAKPR